MINSYTNVKSNHTAVTPEVTRPEGASKFVRNLSAVLISVIVLGSLILGGLSASNDGSALAQAFVQTTTATATSTK
ncbi:hypothetical protein [Secundilactobacillus yichangensis]|uniref:hypothetical protein n=1 Tax=Secundilactobacillus yichangensis TaxID=2799580 RepID=UPI001945190D|nr:hypothetical protein [Secundilactobacillus yichangensis]